MLDQNKAVIGDAVPQILRQWMQVWRPCFTAPSWEHVLVLVMGGPPTMPTQSGPTSPTETSRLSYVQGISTRSVDNLVKAMGLTGISKSSVSRLVEEIDERVNAFLNRPIEGEFPYVWLDATYIKSRQGGRILSTATIIAVGVSADGRREVLGVDRRVKC